MPPPTPTIESLTRQLSEVNKANNTLRDDMFARMDKEQRLFALLARCHGMLKNSTGANEAEQSALDRLLVDLSKELSFARI